MLRNSITTECVNLLVRPRTRLADTECVQQSTYIIRRLNFPGYFALLYSTLADDCGTFRRKLHIKMARYFFGPVHYRDKELAVKPRRFAQFLLNAFEICKRRLRNNAEVTEIVTVFWFKLIKKRDFK